MAYTTEQIRGKQIDTSYLAEAIAGVRNSSYAIVAEAFLEYTQLRQLVSLVNRPILAINAQHKQWRKEPQKLGTLLFPLRRGAHDKISKTTYLYTVDTQLIYKTNKAMLAHALSGEFTRNGNSSDQRYNNLLFPSKPVVYLPGKLSDTIVSKALYKEYTDILALPLLAVQARLLKQAKRNLNKQFEQDKISSKDPARANKQRIFSEYMDLLGIAKDRKEFIVADQDDALSLIFDITKAKEGDALSAIAEPYDRPILEMIRQGDKEALSKALKPLIDCQALRAEPYRGVGDQMPEAKLSAQQLSLQL